ncbi:MAG: iron-sulfur cluster repair di-iron protein [Candidatus Marinimicrobia bacterium]|nr:iron-sulfur cluster repair di-iron protein [Candidatus Neomarinimicrobiota bacterium]MCH7763338.1 iron-sulfur cluster repair di-iron protein [Candidatus Neomarinimicrobiota bacterium]
MIKEKTIGQIVTDDIRTANIFKKHGLDFCCGGGKTIESACAENGVDLAELLHDIDAVLGQSEPVEDYQSMKLDALINYIYDNHHKYIYEHGSVTAEFINKVARVHGERHPETIEIAKLYNELLADLQQHMMKEEQILFPAVKRMLNESGNIGSFVNGPISVMRMEHDNVGEILKKMNALSGGYKPPADGCNTYRAAYANLRDMENDIHLHIHLENNILFPKAIALEEQLLGS